MTNVFVYTLSRIFGDIAQKGGIAYSRFSVKFQLEFEWMERTCIASQIVSDIYVRVRITYLVTGKYLYCLILIVWCLPMHYYWLALMECGDVIIKTQTECPNVFYTILIYIYRAIFLFVIFATMLIYRHFYKLLSKLTVVENYHRHRLLYQFVPIHTVLMMNLLIYTLTLIIGDLAQEDNLYVIFYLLFAFTLVPAIPFVIAMSYLASKDNVRALVVPILQSTWYG
ncbi:unnamed protein product [Caenorhabditis sp. 36 PRJEB53466]|nr:unnamed protein product [Caenorhabditis sp. 36 PRJEB53466]